LNDEYVVSGSDCGNVFICLYNIPSLGSITDVFTGEKSTGALKQLLKGDSDTVNVVEGHPFEPRLAVSGIDDTVKIFGPDQVEQAEFRRLAMRKLRHDSDNDDDEETEHEETQPFIAASNGVDDADDYFNIYDMDPDQPLPGYNGEDEDGISRRNLHNAYSIMSRNEQMRESGVGDAVFTVRMLRQVMFSLYGQ
jgi:DDB1- and CUL4-associated factor 6